VADFALVVNILLIAAGLAAFQATLTLPGIAGIILTIGMAVDANVLIFERIREELDLGKTPRAAVEAGYDRATLTILDANITTLIAALVLFQFGTGPIKGFAVTLSLGVVASVFTSLILTRSLFDLYLSKRKIKQLSI
jgi:preprotein translocase subunit SecD